MSFIAKFFTSNKNLTSSNLNTDKISNLSDKLNDYDKKLHNFNKKINNAIKFMYDKNKDNSYLGSIDFHESNIKKLNEDIKLVNLVKNHPEEAKEKLSNHDIKKYKNMDVSDLIKEIENNEKYVKKFYKEPEVEKDLKIIKDKMNKLKDDIKNISSSYKPTFDLLVDLKNEIDNFYKMIEKESETSSSHNYKEIKNEKLSKFNNSELQKTIQDLKFILLNAERINSHMSKLINFISVMKNRCLERVYSGIEDDMETMINITTKFNNTFVEYRTTVRYLNCVKQFQLDLQTIYREIHKNDPKPDKPSGNIPEDIEAFVKENTLMVSKLKSEIVALTQRIEKLEKKLNDNSTSSNDNLTSSNNSLNMKFEQVDPADDDLTDLGEWNLEDRKKRQTAYKEEEKRLENLRERSGYNENEKKSGTNQNDNSTSSSNENKKKTIKTKSNKTGDFTKDYLMDIMNDEDSD